MEHIQGRHYPLIFLLCLYIDPLSPLVYLQICGKKPKKPLRALLAVIHTVFLQVIG